MSENQAYVVRGEDGGEYGPADLAELRQWVQENRIGLGSDVRLDEPGSLWQPWQYYPELVALLAEVRVSGNAAPVLAPVWRRFIAGAADLILVHILIMPLLFASIFVLPVDLASRLFLQNVVPNALPVQLPFWFELIADSIYFGGILLYYTGFHARHGQTPAKAVLGLRVVDADGQKPVLLKALLRTLVLIVSLFALWSIPLFAIFFTPQRRALHDFAAGTYVIES